MSTIFNNLLKALRLPETGIGKRMVITFFGIILLVGAFVVLIPKQTSTSSQNVVATIAIKSNKIISGPAVVTALKGDTVTFKITTDQPDEIHFHGYDNSVKLEANTVATLSFTASLTGTFEYELEQANIVLGQLEVYPR